MLSRACCAAFPLIAAGEGYSLFQRKGSSLQWLLFQKAQAQELPGA